MIDELHSLPGRIAARATMNLVDRLQDMTQAEQVTSAAALFLLLCDRYDVHHGTALNAANRITTDGGVHRREFDGVRAYLTNELS